MNIGISLVLSKIIAKNGRSTTITSSIFISALSGIKRETVAAAAVVPFSSTFSTACCRISLTLGSSFSPKYGSFAFIVNRSVI